MIRHIRPLYMKAHLNDKPVSKVLVDNGSTVNMTPSRMLEALGRRIFYLIDITMGSMTSLSTFSGEIPKILGVLHIDITMISMTSLSNFTREIAKTLGIFPINIILGSKTSLSSFCD